MTTTARLPRAAQANRGRNLEELLQWQHNTYASFARAFVWKVATPVTMLRRDGAIVGAKPTGTATADFLGVVRDGRGIAVEAKEIAGNHFPWSRIQPQQRECLDAYDRMNGVAAVVLWWTDHDERWALHWSLCKWWMERGKSLQWSEFHAYRIGVGVGPADYLRTLDVTE